MRCRTAPACACRHRPRRPAARGPVRGPAQRSALRAEAPPAAARRRPRTATVQPAPAARCRSPARSSARAASVAEPRSTMNRAAPAQRSRARRHFDRDSGRAARSSGRRAGRAQRWRATRSLGRAAATGSPRSCRRSPAAGTSSGVRSRDRGDSTSDCPAPKVRSAWRGSPHRCLPMAMTMRQQPARRARRRQQLIIQQAMQAEPAQCAAGCQTSHPSPRALQGANVAVEWGHCALQIRHLGWNSCRAHARMRARAARVAREHRASQVIPEGNGTRVMCGAANAAPMIASCAC